VKVIGDECFRCWAALACVIVETGSALEGIETLAFFRTSLQSVVLLRAVNFLGEWCFASIGALGSLVFESGSILTQTGEYSFSGTGLEDLILPSSVEVIGIGCFYFCHSVESLGFEGGRICSELRCSPSPMRFSVKSNFRIQSVSLAAVHFQKC
jgi:hypothetical protein